MDTTRVEGRGDTSGRWSDIKAELGLWRSAGLTPRFWLRDDDAITVTPPLERLRAIVERYRLQVAIAVIPAAIKPDLSGYINAHGARLWPLAHGWTHANHRTQDAPGEFGDERQEAEVRADLANALRVFKHQFPGKPAVFVPPFNHMAPKWITALPGLGYDGVSSSPNIWESRLVRTLANHAWLRLPRLPASASFLRVDAHIDLIDWKGMTARADEVTHHRLLGELRMRRKGSLPPRYPIGLLTHHLVHDEAIWRALERLVDHLKSEGTASFVTCEDVFSRVTSSADRQSIARR